MAFVRVLGPRANCLVVRLASPRGTWPPEVVTGLGLASHRYLADLLRDGLGELLAVALALAPRVPQGLLAELD
jgi:hypothetical protein